eukprot:CAMPEP_0170520708 /NCGR_PEP_ID=MMETSP0209-20121228/6028_1 /TAXON_ID=665100 ORGANISM="Litonotus pictus, Strain P1" /NCGR_SAMPLE_ID=MMETSP0209 /ASSEMBLY_ACC=CAM_ASM_000301 /LENGTH=161 /DNA_ID=CAMNT_0010807187 /DNA_START=530 /DNA_END=1015 /DNA_ORIENTATION=-
MTSHDNTGVLVTGFENGQIIVLDGDSEKTVSELQQIDNEYNLPVVSMISISSKDAFVAGYLNGEIRVFSYTALQLMYIYQAHLKSITSLFAYENYFVSTGDDAFVNVYKIDNNKFDIVRNIGVPNKNPVGAILTKVHGKISLLCCHFDSPMIGMCEGVLEK